MTTELPEFKVLATGMGFPEGPLALPDGSVLVTEIRNQQIQRIYPDGRVDVIACPGGPNGLARGPDGAIYICNNGGSWYLPNHFASMGPAADYEGGSIDRLDLVTGVVTKLYTHCGEHKLSAPNDLVFDTLGGFYFTDFGKKYDRTRAHGGIYYASIDGKSITEVVYPISAPNGIGMSPDGKVIYIAETETARIWGFDIVAPGKVAKQPAPSPHGGRLVYEFTHYDRLDSMGIDGEGNICVATLVTGTITVVTPAGKFVRAVPIPDGYITNICFGGADLMTAYITVSSTGKLVSMKWDRPGLKLNFSA
jgi:gluconolactonase